MATAFDYSPLSRPHLSTCDVLSPRTLAQKKCLIAWLSAATRLPHRSRAQVCALLCAAPAAPRESSQHAAAACMPLLQYLVFSECMHASCPEPPLTVSSQQSPTGAPARCPNILPAALPGAAAQQAPEAGCTPACHRHPHQPEALLHPLQQATWRPPWPLHTDMHGPGHHPVAPCHMIAHVYLELDAKSRRPLHPPGICPAIKHISSLHHLHCHNALRKTSCSSDEQSPAPLGVLHSHSHASPCSSWPCPPGQAMTGSLKASASHVTHQCMQLHQAAAPMCRGYHPMPGDAPRVMGHKPPKAAATAALSCLGVAPAEQHLALLQQLPQQKKYTCQKCTASSAAAQACAPPSACLHHDAIPCHVVPQQLRAR